MCWHPYFVLLNDFLYVGTMKQLNMKKSGRTHAAQKQNYSASQTKNYADSDNIGKKWYSVVSCMLVLHVCHIGYKANAAYP
jgi:hypothetical protein